MPNTHKNDLLTRLATFIVDKRRMIFICYLIALVFCVFSMTWVQVEDDVTKYLPDSTETRLGIEAMNRNFETIATARVMISNVSFDTAQGICDWLSQLEGVSMVTFGDDAEHYQDAAALFDITFSGSDFSPESLDAIANIEETLAVYDVQIDTTIGYDINNMLAGEMVVILIVAVFIILIVLSLTTRAYAEVAVLLINFAAAALINMGTNFVLGRISFISYSVAVVLQLALAIDYAVILCHRFAAEREIQAPREAAIVALRKSIPEISSSSLTTISGLAALGFMQFTIGLDMAMVLMKAIFLSLLTVFTLMPGLLVAFTPIIDRTTHKKLLPNVGFLGRFAVKTRRILPPIFIVVIIAGFIYSSRCPYAFSFNDLKTAKMTDRQHAYFEIKETFGTSNMVAVLVPMGDYEAEKAVLQELEARPEVKGTMGLAGIEAMEGYMLTDALTPRELSELIGLDYEVVQMLYAAYAAQNNQYGEIISGLTEYKVPLFDMFLFLKDQMESRNITLTGGGMEDMGYMLSQLDTAKKQMQSEEYSRLVVYLNLPEEGEETYAFLSTMREIIGKYYEGDDYYIVGNSTSSRDLSNAFVRDNLLISLLSAFFVIIVLLFTFRSVGLPVLLILVIQGSIWINFSIPTFTQVPLYFLGYMIVQALQMGANIDYAIVMSSHYQEYKASMPHKEAIVHAVNAAFPTVFTSGTMLSSAGFLIGNMSAQPVVSIMGNCIGRGTAISVVLVLFILPSILVLGDSIIDRTRFKLKPLPLPAVRQASGTVRVQGHVRGHISGYVDANFDGVLHGQFNASVSTEGTVEERSEEHV